MDNINIFSNHLPVKIHFKENIVFEINDFIASENIRKPLVVTDKGLTELIPSLKEALNKFNNDVIEKSPREPTLEDVNKVAKFINEYKSDGIIAIGGGSVIDTAKAARLTVTQGKPLEDFMKSDDDFKNPSIPLIAIPTTAGTGSEVSGGAVITNQNLNIKVGIANPLIRAQVALIDPVLTYGLPNSVTLYSGIDAIAQAVAAVVAKVRTPIGNAIAYEAIRIGSKALLDIINDNANKDARIRMACASVMSGLAMNISDCTAEHSIAQAIGALYNLPHGLTVGLVFAETIEREEAHLPELMNKVSKAFDDKIDEKASVKIKRLLRKLNFPTFKEVGIKKEDFEEIANKSINDFFITQSPVKWSKKEVLSLLKKCYSIDYR